MSTYKILTSTDRGRVIDSETGIVRYLSEIPNDPGDPKIFNYSAKMADTSRFLPIGCYDSNGGAGLTRDEAQWAAIGEAIERYCCSVYFTDELLLGSYAEVTESFRALKPGEIALFHPKQKKSIRYAWFTEQTKVCWTTGYSITKREPLLIPASLVYIPYYPFRMDEGEETIGPSISTGQASAYSYEDALLRGMYEIVERDAFTISWLNRLPLPKISIKSSVIVSEVFQERFAAHKMEYTLFSMATDLEIPSIVCLLIDYNRTPPLVCTGGASNINPDKAALKALVEAAQTHKWAVFLGKRDKPLIIESDYSNIDDFEKHVFLYAYGDMMDALTFLTKNKQEISFSEIPDFAGRDFTNQTGRVLRQIQSRGHEVMIVDLTTPDVSECGYCVLKVLIPSMQQLEGDHNHRMLGGPRIYQVPAKVGYSTKCSFDTLNPDPHPYP